MAETRLRSAVGCGFQGTRVGWSSIEPVVTPFSEPALDGKQTVLGQVAVVFDSDLACPVTVAVR